MSVLSRNLFQIQVSVVNSAFHSFFWSWKPHNFNAFFKQCLWCLSFMATVVIYPYPVSRFSHIWLVPCGLQPVRLLCPWDYSGKNTAADCHEIFQGNHPDPEIEPSASCVFAPQADSLPLSHQGSPYLSVSASGKSRIAYSFYSWGIHFCCL